MIRTLKERGKIHCLRTMAVRRICAELNLHPPYLLFNGSGSIMLMIIAQKLCIARHH